MVRVATVLLTPSRVSPEGVCNRRLAVRSPVRTVSFVTEMGTTKFVTPGPKERIWLVIPAKFVPAIAVPLVAKSKTVSVPVLTPRRYTVTRPLVAVSVVIKLGTANWKAVSSSRIVKMAEFCPPSASPPVTFARDSKMVRFPSTETLLEIRMEKLVVSCPWAKASVPFVAK